MATFYDLRLWARLSVWTGIVRLLPLLCILAAPARASLTITPAGAAEGLSLSTFATGFPHTIGGSGGDVGPMGIAFPSSGGVLVADFPGNLRLFPTDADGQSAASAPVGQSYGLG